VGRAAFANAPRVHGVKDDAAVAASASNAARAAPERILHSARRRVRLVVFVKAAAKHSLPEGRVAQGTFIAVCESNATVQMVY